MIDHPHWPFAFVMKRADAKELFDTGPRESDFYSPLEIMQKASNIATAASSRSSMVAIFPKESYQNYLGGWAVGTALDPADEQKLQDLAQGGLQRAVGDIGQVTAVAFTVTTGALAVPAGVGAVAVDVVAAEADVVSGRTGAGGGAVVLTAAAAGAFFHLRVAHDALGAAGGLIRRGGAARVQAGVAAENRVAATIGVSRNVGPGRITIECLTGSAGFRVPDFGPEATIALRGSIVEVKNVTRLQITPQIRDLIDQVKYLRETGPRTDLVLEIFTNGRIPVSGEIVRLQEQRLLRITPIP